jgi:hypothetical protein
MCSGKRLFNSLKVKKVLFFISYGTYFCYLCFNFWLIRRSTVVY